MIAAKAMGKKQAAANQQSHSRLDTRRADPSKHAGSTPPQSITRSTRVAEGQEQLRIDSEWPSTDDVDADWSSTESAETNPKGAVVDSEWPATDELDSGWGTPDTLPKASAVPKAAEAPKAADALKASSMTASSLRAPRIPKTSPPPSEFLRASQPSPDKPSACEPSPDKPPSLEVPTVSDTPATEAGLLGAPSIDVAPVVSVGVADAPPVADAPSNNDAPSNDTAPSVNDAPSIDAAPAVSDAPSNDDSPAVNDAPSNDDSPSIDAAPAVYDTPSPADKNHPVDDVASANSTGGLTSGRSGAFVIAAVILLGAGGLWLASRSSLTAPETSKHGFSTHAPIEPTESPSPNLKAAAAPDTKPAAAQTEPAARTEPAKAEPSDVPPVQDKLSDVPPAPDKPAAQAAPSDAPDEPAAAAPQSAGSATTVTLTIVPSDARIYHRGKLVGTSPLQVELPPGERRAFEVARDGYVLRKVVLDGSEPEVKVGLRPSKTP